MKLKAGARYPCDKCDGWLYWEGKYEEVKEWREKEKRKIT